MSQIANVKKDMIILEKSEFSALRSENEVKLKSHSYLSSAFSIRIWRYNACTQKCTKKCTPQMKKWSLTGTPRPAVTHSSHSSHSQNHCGHLTWPLTGFALAELLSVESQVCLAAIGYSSPSFSQYYQNMLRYSTVIHTRVVSSLGLL